MIYQFKTDGISSERAVVRYLDGVPIEDLSNPANPVTTVVNFIIQGYADNSLLTGLDAGDQNTRDSFKITIVNGKGDIATIRQGGVDKPCDKLPFLIREVAPTVPIFIFNVPLVADTYYCTVVYTKPNGEDTTFDEFVLVVSNKSS